MMAELLAKDNGYCRGRGGSMHIADVATGNLGANGIVAGGTPDRGRRRPVQPVAAHGQRHRSASTVTGPSARARGTRR